MGTREELESGRKAVTLKWITLNQLKLCLELQQQYSQRGQTVSLYNLFIKENYLTQAQIESIISGKPLNISQTQIKTQTKAMGSTVARNSPQNSATFSLQPGEMFHHYQIQELLGEGGMGVVYKVLDTQLKRILALKFIRSVNNSEKENQRFLQEAAVTANLDHPNIVKLFTVGETPIPHFTMEYLQGCTFSELIKANEVRPLKAVKILQKIAEALHEAHKHNIIHRDIKPSNIMVVGKTPKIMDFGLAKVTASESKLSQTGDVVGTPAYMSPEQAQGEQTGPKSDIYSLGATLYEALTSRPPFQGNSYYNVVNQILTADPVPPRTLNPDISVELEAICMKCLDKSPQKRYINARQLAKDLKNFLERRPIIAHSPNAIARFKKFYLRNKILCLVALVVFLVIASVATTYIVVTENHNQQLIAEKTKAEKEWENLQQEVEKAKREKKNSIYAAQKMFQPLNEIYWTYRDLNSDPELITGLKKVFRELERLEVLKNLRNDIAIYWLYGLMYGESANSEEFHRGMGAYNEIIQQRPKDSVAYNNRGYLYLLYGYYKKAEEDIKKAQTLGYNSSTVYFNMGNLYTLQGRYEEAETYYKKWINLPAGNAGGYNSLGYLCMIRGELKEAKKLFSQCLKLDPTDTDAYRNLGDMAYDQGQYKESLKYYTIALQYKPNSAYALDGSANVYRELENYKKAQQYYLKALKYQPHSMWIKNNLAKLYKTMNQHDKAQALYREILQNNRISAEEHLFRGYSYEELGEPQKAKHNYDKSIQVNPKYTLGYLKRGIFYYKQKQYQKAERDFNLAIHNNPQFSKIYFHRGFIYFDNKQDQKAILDWKKAIAINPSHNKSLKKYLLLAKKRQNHE